MTEILTKKEIEQLLNAINADGEPISGSNNTKFINDRFTLVTDDEPLLPCVSSEDLDEIINKEGDLS